ncbi:hypothetical protein SPRG_19963 [Saprolegnia parasitica CBS 223.65]|uniref:Cns1/TTC4 wheel domain-containing protein n=1 Tax=Saprolegnia parasitica (strain CBS 223.65) TaxID=695850 RepID=A0A067CDD4_SAPPC|nr:hypothetical protein SPRG_19963 [Saprolegnia parasitica CBS 223.65]KDO28749.1 hypothetical protein SPRG_19963 [Saprolegnia parasitica CBS 223.65]|eukprot:XP_012200496.1 hypothetical protein SPRG_19963 [Saprolegnia parasitica CBS 223.65]
MSVELEIDESKVWSPEERQAYLDQIPEMSLFEDHILEGDVMVDAMMALVEEGETAETLALKFKNKGNKMFADAKKSKNHLYYEYAIKEYSDALAYGLKALAAPTPADELAAMDLDEPIRMPALMTTILSNRAAAHLALKNYGSCRSDAARALQHDSKHLKSIYRGAKASAMLKKPADTLRYCKVGLAIDATNKELLVLQRDGEKMLEEQRQQAELDAFKAKKAHAMVEKYRKLCTLRNVRVGRGILDDARVKDFEGKADLDEEGVMCWPVLFLYDEYGQSDFIQSFGEQDMFIEHLANMFPEEGPFCFWDKRQDYVASQLQVYVAADVVVPFATPDAWHVALNGAKESDAIESARLDADEKHGYKHKVWLRVSPFCKLYRLLSHHQYVVPGIPVINIMVRGSKQEASFLDAIDVINLEER